MTWVADQSKTVTFTAVGEGYASITIYPSTPQTKKPGEAVSVYCDLTNTGPVPDTFMVSYNVNGAITNYDVNGGNPVEPGATAPRILHTFTMPTNDVNVTVTGHHWAEGAGIRIGIPGLSRLGLPPIPNWAAQGLVLIAMASPIILVGSAIAASQIRR